MITGAKTPFSDAWWLKKLLAQFSEKPAQLQSPVGDRRRAEYTRREWLDMLWARFTGNAPLVGLQERYATPTREFMRLTRTNYAALVVEALQNRTQFLGVRTGADGDANGDDTVRAFMAENGAFFNDALTYAFSLGSSAVMIQPPAAGSEYAIATAEDPRQVAWSVDPLRPTIVRAAVKLYRDDDLGADVAHLHIRGGGTDPETGEPLLDRVRVGVRTGRGWTGQRFDERSWEWDEERSGPLPDNVQGSGVPLVPLVNRLGMGEFEAHIDVIDRISNGIGDRLWTGKYQTFLQRALIGELPETDPETGERINYDEIFTADPGALWRMPEGASVWESKQVDFSPLLAGSRADLQELSANTFTPMFMFSPDAAAGSAEGASLTREGMTFKAEDRIARISPASLQITRLGLIYSGKPEIARGQLEAMWAPVERFSLQERGAAAVQAKGSGVPTRSILSDIWQFPPETVARMEKERRADLVLNGAAAPAPTPSVPAAAQQQ